MITMEQMLDALHGGCDGLVELRAIQPGNGHPDATFLKPGDVHGLTTFLGDHVREHVYVAVATRRDHTSGRLDNCLALPALFVDLDFKTIDEDVARQRLYDFPFPPSIAVLSGGGLHVYWLLREPLNLQDSADRRMAYSLLRRLAQYLGADLQAAEPARCLRLPGSSNFKYDPPRRARLDHLAEELRYNASDFDLLPPDRADNGDRAQPFTSAQTIREGERNGQLYRLGRALKLKGLSPEAITAALHAENRAKCDPPLDEAEVAQLAHHAASQADRDAFQRSATDDSAAPDTARLGIGLGQFLAQAFPPITEYVEGVMSDEGGGWIAGEEKLGKTFYALEEALCLALGLPVCGRFTVPVRRKVLFIEEEDGPRRTHARVHALLRGHDVEPTDPAVQADLDAHFQIAVWTGFTLDQDAMLDRLDAACVDFAPSVVYLDVLRKLTTRDLNKAPEASLLLASLDTIRRRYGCLFRVVHHYRKNQGFRVGRGSQEISGSYVLGAWAENSLFFEPIGRKQGAVRVEVQTKDGPPVPAFRLTIEAEGDDPATARIRLVAMDTTDDTAVEKLKEQVREAVATLPTTEATTGTPGVTKTDICRAVKRSDRPVKTALQALEDDGTIRVVGKATRGRKLYAITKDNSTASAG